MTAATQDRRSDLRLRRALLALAMLLVQMVTPALSMAAHRPVVPLDLVICHAGVVGDATPGPDAPPAPHQHDCTLCPACHVAPLPVLAGPGSAVIPAPPLARADHAAPPPATGPPGLVRLAARPRGPPASAV